LTRLPIEFNFRSEVLPILMIGIILDLFGRFAAANLEPSLFLDMCGTMMTAVLLGPWWGAAVGTASNAINGTAFDDFFPFGLVTIVGGLVWGYGSRAMDFRAKIIDSSASWRTIARAYIILAVTGILACSAASLAIKLMLYPPMGRSLEHGKLYVRTYDLLSNTDFKAHAAILTLMGVDFMRESIDKGIVVAIGLACSIGIGFAAGSVAGNRMLDKLKVDVPSIACFSLVYGGYLLLARIAHPDITFEGAATSVHWLKFPPAIAAFYAPILLALLVFFLGTFSLESEHGRSIECYRFRRTLGFRRAAPKFSFREKDIETQNLYKVLSRGKIYGLMATVAAWPFGKDIDRHLVASLYFFLALVFVGVFFYDNRARRSRLLFAERTSNEISTWTGFNESAAVAANMLRLIAVLFRRELSATLNSPPLRSESIVYAPCLMRDHAAAAGPGSFRVNKSTGLLAVSVNPSVADAGTVEAVITIARDNRLSDVLFLSLTPLIYDSAVAQQIISAEGEGISVTLLAWIDLAKSLDGYVKQVDRSSVLAQARLRTIEYAMKAQCSTDRSISDAMHLAARSLPVLTHILSDYPKGTLVMDVGAGRGRHTLLAQSYGHRVIAVERQHAVFEDLVENARVCDESVTLTDFKRTDFTQIEADSFESPQMVICTGVLQHARNKGELIMQINRLREFAGRPGASIYIEMLLGMKFDDSPPNDGRIEISIGEFEKVLEEAFQRSHWRLQRTNGPLERLQNFDGSPRSFFPPAKQIRFITSEYFISQRLRRNKHKSRAAWNSQP
jgi:hypothetical protein